MPSFKRGDSVRSAGVVNSDPMPKLIWTVQIKRQKLQTERAKGGNKSETETGEGRKGLWNVE